MQHSVTAIRLALMVALGLPGPVLADESDLARLRAEMAALRAQYETRLAELAREVAALAARPSASRPAGEARGASVAAFNPEVSLVLNGRYRHAKVLEEPGITGFVAGGHGHDDEGHGGAQRGFLLDESELVLAANVDHLFRGQLNLALVDETVEVEEAWIQTLALGHGATAKAGRFLSGVGYANGQHPHAWDFADPALMYVALFGEHGSYAQDGLQLSWVAPLEQWVELGVELGRGSAFPGTERNRDGLGATAAFVRTGGDVGDSSSWRAGVSWLGTRAHERDSHFEDVVIEEEVAGAFSGTSRMWIVDARWTWAPDGNPAARYLTLQAEAFRRVERGDLACVADESPGCADIGMGDYRTRQWGGYVQAVYQFRRGWRAGLRLDRLSTGTVDHGAANDRLDRPDYSPTRASVMVDWNPSEFSRLRVQYARDRSVEAVTDHQWTLQYVMSLGAHPSHTF